VRSLLPVHMKLLLYIIYGAFLLPTVRTVPGTTPEQSPLLTLDCVLSRVPLADEV
jgi:hypothetical protein